MTRLLVQHQGFVDGNPAGHSAAPFRANLHALRKRGLLVEFQRVDKVEEVAAVTGRPDVVFCHLSWHWDAVAARAALESLRARNIRIAFVDYYATVGSPFFGLSDVVDVYVKRQIPRDREWFRKPLVGRTFFSDFVHHHGGLDLSQWGWHSVPGPDFERKLELGWNLGSAPQYLRLSRMGRHLRPLIPQRFELHRRFFVGTDHEGWVGEWRRRAFSATQSLKDLKMTGGEAVPRRQFRWELLESRACFSPFGWGEICFRDFEAVALGAVLVKPDMSHLESEPDIYLSDETYVPVRWDFADLEQKLREVLADPTHCRQLARAAHERLESYFREERFVKRVEAIVRKCLA